MKDNSGGGFMKGVSLVVIVALIAKLIGAVYRIPLTNILGGNGIGLYQLAFPIYALILTLSGSSIPTLIARNIAEQNALENAEARDRNFVACFWLLVITGAGGAMILSALAYPIALMQGEAGLTYGYLLLCPSIIFVSVSGALRGWYQGKTDMRPFAFMQLAEQACKLIVGIALSIWLTRYGLIYGVMGAFLAVTISELIGMFTMIALYRRDKNRAHLRRVKPDANTLKIVGKSSVPLIVNGLVLPIVAFIESIILVRLLGVFGADNPVSDYGMLTGVANTLINMPVVVAIALSVLVVPTVAKYRAGRNLMMVKAKANLGVRLSMLIGVPCFVLMSLLPDKIIGVLYPSLTEAAMRQASLLLAVGGIQVVLISVQQIYASVLQGLGYQSRIMRATAIGGALKLLLDAALVPVIGIAGAVIAAIAAFSVIVVINTFQYGEILGESVSALRSVTKTAVSGLIMAVTAFAASFIENKYLSLGVGALSVLVYAVSMTLLKAFSREELNGLPFFGRLSRKTH